MGDLGVVIPTLNEARHLPGLLADLRQLPITIRVVVADGGSHDRTVPLARAAGADTVITARGRATQMNVGARLLQHPWLCFLHADVRLAAPARADLERTIADPRVDAAVWRLAIDAEGWWFRIVERGARWRDRVGGLAYGDQGLLVRRRLFERVGGFPEIPVMEDVALIRRLRRVARVRRLSSALLVSPRRWRREGPYRTLLRNTSLLTAYLAGVSPHRLVRWYPPEPG